MVPVYCEQKTDFVTVGTPNFEVLFDANCLSWADEATQPTVFLESNYARFNITRKATFTNITFSGLQQMIDCS